MDKRTFKPTRKYVGSTAIETKVDHWEWTRGHGLRCFYTDGHVVRSDYRSIRELFVGEPGVTEVHVYPDPSPAYIPFDSTPYPGLGYWHRNGEWYTATRKEARMAAIAVCDALTRREREGE